MMIQKVLIALLIGLGGFFIWLILLFILFIGMDSYLPDALVLPYTGLFLLVIWFLTRKIFEKFDS